MQRLEKDQKKELARILHCRTSAEKTLSAALQNPVGIHNILKSLENDELKLFKAIYEEGGEVKNFTTLEKKTHIPIAKIDRYATTLSHKALVYVIKNRQLLTNKMDKIYPIKEIFEQLNFLGTTELLDNLSRLHEALSRKKPARSEKKPARPDEKGETLLVTIAESGGLLELEKIIANNSFRPALEKCIKDEIMALSHVISHPGISVVYLTDKAAPLLKNISLKKKKKAATPVVHNHYRVLINLLLTYDIISTYGLFLTKQGQIRKIDLKRIADNLIRTTSLSGEEEDRDTLSSLILFWLSALETVRIQRDAATISLRPLRKDLENPVALMIKLLHAFDSVKNVQEVFLPERRYPSYRTLTGFLKIIASIGEAEIDYLRWTIHAGRLAAGGKKQFYSLFAEKESIIKEIDDGISLLCLMGLVYHEHGKIRITDIGEEVAHRLFKMPLPPREEEIIPSIYINADFTLILAERELPSLALYYLLAHTDLENDDVIIHATITRESIIKARKRGLSLENFLTTLDEHARNRIPQNLVFLLSEWAKQTISVTMKRVILLETGHTTFLDEIIYGQKDESMIRRISPNHAIVAKDFLETVIKKARKKDAAISLFEEEEDMD